MKKRSAFTLIELLVVIAIIGLLSTVAVVSTQSAQMNARNMKRKADLVQIGKALELYYAANGAYPSTGSSSNYLGACASYFSKADSGANGWIPDLAPTYIGILPRDPNFNKANTASANVWCHTNPTASCYVYTSNGTDYKVAIICTPEGTLSTTDPFAQFTPSFSNYIWQISTPGAKNW